jgi:hypothetical protein
MPVCLYVCPLPAPRTYNKIWVLTRNIGHSPVHTRCNIGLLGSSLVSSLGPLVFSPIFYERGDPNPSGTVVCCRPVIPLSAPVPL